MKNVINEKIDNEFKCFLFVSKPTSEACRSLLPLLLVPRWEIVRKLGFVGVPVALRTKKFEEQ